mgnify:CR=1 FL=1
MDSLKGEIDMKDGKMRTVPGVGMKRHSSCMSFRPHSAAGSNLGTAAGNFDILIAGTQPEKQQASVIVIGVTFCNILL